MAELTGKTISQLPNTSTLVGQDLFLVSSGGVSSKIAWESLKNQIESAFTTSNLDVNTMFGGSVTGIESIVGKKRFDAVDAYVTFNSSISSGIIGSLVSGYRPAHACCFPIFSASSPYGPLAGAVWVYPGGDVQLYYNSGTPGYAYLNYLV